MEVERNEGTRLHCWMVLVQGKNDHLERENEHVWVGVERRVDWVRTVGEGG